MDRSLPDPMQRVNASLHRGANRRSIQFANTERRSLMGTRTTDRYIVQRRVNRYAIVDRRTNETAIATHSLERANTVCNELNSELWKAALISMSTDFADLTGLEVTADDIDQSATRRLLRDLNADTSNI
jgi:hypothetical protein